MKITPALLRKWRVLKIGVVLYLSIILWQFKDWIMESAYKDLGSGVQSIVISVVVSAIIAGLFAVVNKADEPIRDDEDEG